MTGASPKQSEGVLVPPVYPIIDIDLCRMRGVEPAELAAAFVAGGARLLQVRAKATDSGDLLSVTRDAVACAQTSGALVIVNDRADIAAMAKASGVHVGQSDLPVDAARDIAGPDAIVGVSTHTREQVDEALAGAASYVAVGPVFQTRTKDTGYEPRGLDLIRYAAGRGKPVIAIGGITIENAREVVAAGAAGVAIISDLMVGPSPAERVRACLLGISARPFNV